MRRFGKRVLIAPLALALAFSAGCKAEHLESTGTDDAYIRPPEAKATPLAAGSGPLWPLTPGNRWDFVVATAARDGKTAPVQGKETLIVLGPRTVGKGSGVAVQVLQNGKAFREEVLRLDDNGLSLVAAGIASVTGNDTMSITSNEPGGPQGIPLVQLPVVPGAVARWDGILKLLKKNVAAPGTSHSRVSALEKVKTPAGEYNAYRVETMIQTTVEGQQIFLYTIRWITPGIGLVRQRVITPGQVVTKDLVKFAGK
jgi:hypothetical protein